MCLHIAALWPQLGLLGTGRHAASRQGFSSEGGIEYMWRAEHCQFHGRREPGSTNFQSLLPAPGVWGSPSRPSHCTRQTTSIESAILSIRLVRSLRHTSGVTVAAPFGVEAKGHTILALSRSSLQQHSIRRLPRPPELNFVLRPTAGYGFGSRQRECEISPGFQPSNEMVKGAFSHEPWRPSLGILRRRLRSFLALAYPQATEVAQNHPKTAVQTS